MSDYGMYPGNNDTVKRWRAEGENAAARERLARIHECCKLLLSQHDPVARLDLDRKRLGVVLDFVLHGDPARLRREVEALLTSAS